MPEMKQDRIALDRSASARSLNADGHMRVVGSAVSKANVCDYWGAEIPDADKLGLNPNKTYKLYRDAASLEAAAPSLNGKPLLIIHRPQTADDHDHEVVVGSLDNVRWDAPYLRADITLWSQEAIDAVESGEQKQLSCGYRYVAKMEPGVAPDGSSYDGLMTQIEMNHCALVSEGRAGPDVFVGDAKPASLNNPQENPMAKANVSRQVLLATTTGAAGKSKKPEIRAALDAALKTKLGADADISDIVEMLDQLESMADDPAAEDEFPVEKKDDEDEGEKSDKDAAKDKGAKDKGAKDKGAKDMDPEPGVNKAAMDAAIAKATRDAEMSVIARMNAIAKAKEDVRPHVGAISGAMDSAPAVYKLALDGAQVDLTGVPEAAYEAMVRMLPLPDAVKAAPKTRMAADSSVTKAYADRFPNANRLAR